MVRALRIVLAKRIERFAKLVFLQLLLLVSAAGIATRAHADENGSPTGVGKPCNKDAMSSVAFICDKLASIGITACTVNPNNCVAASQEVFTGTTIEFATPATITTKKWTGFGGTGDLYAKAALCLLRDLQLKPITADAKVATAIGDVATHQTVSFLSFDPKTLHLEALHRTEVCAPVLGCLDGVNQRIAFTEVATNLTNMGQGIGEYPLYGTQALLAETDGAQQTVATHLPSIKVITPYGVISATPDIAFARASGWALAPYAAGNTTSTYVNAAMRDVYGRKPGLALSQQYPPGAGRGLLVGANPFRGWISQVGFGGRSGNPLETIWSPLPGLPFPPRPDFSYKEPRSPFERGPNFAMTAQAELKYSPTDLLPPLPFVTPTFNITVTPAIATGYASQLQLWNSEVSRWYASRTQVPLLTPLQFDTERRLYVRGAAATAANFKLTAAIELKLHLHINLGWFGNIDEDLINIHPSDDFVNVTETATQVSPVQARAESFSPDALKTGALFQNYAPLTGGVTNGVQHIQACLAAPASSQPPPPPPKWDPGNAQDLFENAEYPCNLCLGSKSYEYPGDKEGEKKTQAQWLKMYFPADFNTRPPNVQTRCNYLHQVGCYDRCSFNPQTKKLTVLKTAQERYAAGTFKHPRCPVP